jgi:hypothetical protein
METIYVKINPQAGQFWDPSNKKQKMLVGKGIFEVQNTATIQNGLSAGALSNSTKEDFEKQEALKTEKPSEKTVEKSKTEEPKLEEPKPATKTTKK